jgi:hypothetical protein
MVLKHLLRLFALPILALALATSGLCAAGNHPTSYSQRPPASDAQIEATIRAKLAKSKIGRDGFRFHVQRGVVTWEGTTDVMQHKGSATRMAHAAGAVQVVNNIKVSAAAKAKAAGNLHKATVQE